MARRPLKTKEQIAAVPLDQSVELDMTPDDPVVEIIHDMEPPTNGVAAEARVPDPTPEPIKEPENDRLALKKQADDLRAAEEARAAGERQRQELEALQKRNQELEDWARRSQASEVGNDYDRIVSALERMQAESRAAELEYQNAAAVGDHNAMAEANRKFIRAETRIATLEDGKTDLEEKIDQWKRQQAQQPPQQQQPQMTPDQLFEAHIQQFPDLVKDWTRKHRDYMEYGSAKNKKLQRAHLDADISGIALYTQDYLDFIEKQIGLRPNDEDEAPDLEPVRRTPVSAPVSRESVSPSTGRPTTQKITLSAEERSFARDLQPGMDPGEAERIYAQNKLRLMEAKKNGQYKE